MLTLEAYTTPVNYQGANGNWVPIDNTLVEAPGNAYAVENAAGSYSASLPENPATTPVRVEADGVWVTMKMNGVTDDPAVGGSAATYDEVAKADSVTYQATNTGLKEDVVLSAAPPVGQPLRYTYALAASPGVTPSVSAAGSVQFKNGSGKVVMEIPRGNMIDSATPRAEMTGAVSYALAPAGAGWTLTMTPDLAWLTDPARVYPVTIDPTVTTGATRDCWIIKSNVDGNGCGVAATHIRTGRKNADDVYRGLLGFDVGSIPATATVNTATISLYLDATQSYSSEIASYGFNLAGKPWDWPTWNTTGISSTTWNGGDPTGTARGVRNLRGDEGGRYDFTGLADVVQGWANGTIPNNGLVLKQVNEDTNNVVWFKSSSSSAENDGQRPHLEVTYDTPPPPMIMSGTAPQNVDAIEVRLREPVSQTDGGLKSQDLLVDAMVELQGADYAVRLDPTDVPARYITDTGLMTVELQVFAGGSLYVTHGTVRLMVWLREEEGLNGSTRCVANRYSVRE